MDQIRYEAGGVKKELKKEQEEYDSILRQLELTDYEQIRQKLDECMEWLKEYPERLQSCVAEKTQNEERIRALSEQAAQNEERIVELKRRAEYLETCFAAERSLHYVELPGEEAETEEPAEKIRSLLAGECRDMDKEQIIRSLNQVYFENRGFLTDYQIMQTERSVCKASGYCGALSGRADSFRASSCASGGRNCRTERSDQSRRQGAV